MTEDERATQEVIKQYLAAQKKTPEVRIAFRKIWSALLTFTKQILLLSVELLIKVSIVVWILKWLEVIE